MHTAPTLIDTPTTPARKRKGLVIGTVAGVLVLAVAGGAGYAYHEHNKPSQASAADCRMAQDLVDQSRKISTGPVPVAEKWAKESGDKRRTEMKDGYLGYNVGTYQGWAVETAKQNAGRSAEVPTKQDVKALQSKVRGHCSDSGVTVTLPQFGS
jgi:hypothetical protein